MRKVSINELELGQELARAVRVQSPHPGVLYKLRIPQGTPLTNNHVRRLHRAGVPYVYIKDRDLEDLTEFIVDEDLEHVQDQVAGQMKEVVGGMEDGTIDAQQIQELTDTMDQMIEALRRTKVMMAFTTLKTHDDYTAKHSMDVSQLSVYLTMNFHNALHRRLMDESGASYGYTQQYMLEDLGIGALLHDLGKWRIPQEILSKPGKLDAEEWEIIQGHPDDGYQAMKKLRGEVRAPVRIPALQHHEKFGGNGYPGGKKGKEIHIYGRISACCDVYSALTSSRSYRKAMTPAKALSIMAKMQKEDRHFDPDIFKKFLTLIPPYPIGQEVKLDNDTRGVVCELKEGNNIQPIVRVLYEGGERLDSPYEIQANTPSSPRIVE